MNTTITRGKHLHDDVSEAKRLAECTRKAEYRARQRNERALLQAQVLHLKIQLQSLLRHKASQQRQAAAARATRPLLHQGGFSANQVQHATLREQLRRHRVLMTLLHRWVGGMVDQTLDSGRCWLHSTLLTEPTARQYGFRWLTDRVFHSALSSTCTVTHSASTLVDDFMRYQIHTDADGLEFLASESHVQATYFADYTTVADCLWDSFANERYETVLREGDFLYQRVYNTFHRISTFVILRRYTLPNRVVFVRVFLSEDEALPLQANQRRQNGFAWITMDKITDGVTLYRSNMVQFPIRTTDKTPPFETLVSVFGVETHPTRGVTMARLKTKAQQLFERQTAHRYGDLANRLLLHTDE
ncbi:Aste57867_12572 [Aphanomyces stellatus]|uniref:Aste57867_12572 protein n=1 Tax=Aphanomyces stellatus TaxID=120398 RepID=A0A485KWR0_9STRA|nr:hypothetical protein As57867_012526 [Aphanomyces stellatus]VFT89423.1 Aste57867_12572 [Aphanomyces stellatus]